MEVEKGITHVVLGDLTAVHDQNAVVISNRVEAAM
jgi:2-succinyl-5-enolpyruvyl-6-hydroxy-3-cyclohexene-1-carboxylate synthase